MRVDEDVYKVFEVNTQPTYGCWCTAIPASA